MKREEPVPTLAEEYEQLLKEERRVQALRSESETLRKVAAQQVAAIDQEITALGVKPDLAEQELAALQDGLREEIVKAREALAAEAAQYQQILDAAKAAGLR